MKSDIQTLLEKGFFRLAKNASKNSDHPNHKIGCVIALNGNPVSISHNKDKTHPIYANPNNSIRKSIHAEISAIIQADCDVSGGVVYLWREWENGKPSISRPCNRCWIELRKHGIKRVYYTDDLAPFWKKEDI